jgi:hypothetical protein
LPIPYDRGIPQLRDFLGFPAIPNPADQLEKLGIPSFSWEFPMIFHRGWWHGSQHFSVPISFFGIKFYISAGNVTFVMLEGLQCYS